MYYNSILSPHPANIPKRNRKEHTSIHKCLHKSKTSNSFADIHTYKQSLLYSTIYMFKYTHIAVNKCSLQRTK